MVICSKDNDEEIANAQTQLEENNAEKKVRKKI